MDVQRKQGVVCECVKPSVVSHNDRDWFCGRCGGTLPTDHEPDPEVVKLSDEVRGRAEHLESLADFKNEFGSPSSLMPRDSSDEDLEMLSEQGVLRQATWRFDDALSLVVQELPDGTVRYVIGW